MKRILALALLAALLAGCAGTATKARHETAKAHYDRGCALYKEGDFDQAIAEYEAAIRLDSGDARYYNNRGHAYYGKGDNDRAIADFTRAILLDSNNAEKKYHARGFVYFINRDFDRAIADQTQVIRLDPNNAYAYHNRGRSHQEKGDNDLAIADFDQAVRLNPNIAETYLNRGEAYRRKGDYDLAIADLTQAIGLNSDLALAYSIRGTAYLNKDDFDNAIADYTQAIRLDPNDVTTYNNRGSAYEGKGDFDLAIADFTQVIDLDPDGGFSSIAAYNNRGQAYTKKGDFDLAIADFTRAIGLDPDCEICGSDCGIIPFAYNGRGKAYFNKGDLDSAIEDFTEAIDLSLDYADAYQNRGKAYFDKGDFDSAIADYEEVLRIDPDHKDHELSKQGLEDAKQQRLSASGRESGDKGGDSDSGEQGMRVHPSIQGLEQFNTSGEWSDLNWSEGVYIIDNDGSVSITAERSGRNRNQTLEIENGTFIGSDRGEFGGGLTFSGETGEYEIGGVGNVRGIVKFNNGIYVLTGLAHLTMDYGQIVKLENKNGKWESAFSADLNGSPDMFAIFNDRLYIVTGSGIEVFDGNKVQDFFIYRFWSGLYPRSIYVNEEIIAVGMRGCLAVVSRKDYEIKAYRKPARGARAGAESAVIPGEFGFGWDSDLGGLAITCGPKNNPRALKATLIDGTLKISGTGAMINYGDGVTPPWIGMSSVTDVVIEEGITHIGVWAFARLRGLSSVTIPASAASIGKYAFDDCHSLTSIKVAAGNANYSSVDGVLFNRDKTAMILYPMGRKGAYTIPNTVTAIGESAFYKRDNLTSIKIPNSVAAIGKSAFLGCDGLTSVTIPGNVKSIGENAFLSCRGLTSVTIEDGVASIGKSAFWGCKSLPSVAIPASVTFIGGGAFTSNTKLTSIKVAAGNPRYSSVDGALFNKDKTTLLQLPPGRAGAYTIPGSVTSVGYGAFYHCDGMTSVNRKDVDAGKPLWHCTGLTSLTSLNPVPPANRGENKTFDVFMPSYICLYVPKGSVDAYRAANGWKDFKCIKDLESAPKKKGDEQKRLKKLADTAPQEGLIIWEDYSPSNTAAQSDASKASKRPAKQSRKSGTATAKPSRGGKGKGKRQKEDAGESHIRRQIIGEWLFEEISKNDEHEEINAVRRSLFRFRPNGSVYLEESKKGQSTLSLKEDWEFRSWGVYSVSGDTIKLAINRFQAVRQNFEELQTIYGKPVWKAQPGPTFDTTITDGSQDRYIPFEDLKMDFKKVRSTSK